MDLVEKPEEQDGLRRLWGRRQSFALRPRQQALFETLLPKVVVALPEDARSGIIDPRTFFAPARPRLLPLPRGEGEGEGFPAGDPADGKSAVANPSSGSRTESGSHLLPEGEGHKAPGRISLEIGFGGGEHLIAWAKARADEGFIGAEPFVNGMGKMLAHLDDEKVLNVRLFAGDARRLVEALAGATLARVWVLFPDPWPKKRHWKRRYVQDETLTELARVLEPGGMLRIASDVPAYIAWTLEHIATRPEFAAVHDGDGWRARPADWPPTRYEQKALREGRVPTYLEWRRV